MSRKIKRSRDWKAFSAKYLHDMIALGASDPE